uniref:A-kinase anchor protein 5-like isoform X2 n=1 Tax=Myxine glutinosa TaxID=7769 RepID=UPI00358F1DBC
MAALTLLLFSLIPGMLGDQFGQKPMIQMQLMPGDVGQPDAGQLEEFQAGEAEQAAGVPNSGQQDLEAGNLSQTEAGNLSQTGAGNLSQTEAGNLSQTEAGNLSQTEAGDLSQTEAGNLSQTEAGNLSQTEAGNLSQTEAGNLSQTEALNLSQTEAWNLSQTEAGNLSQTEAGNLSQTEAGNLSQTEARNLSQTQAGNLSQTEAGNLSQTEARNLSQTEARNLSQTEAGNLSQTEAGNSGQSDAVSPSQFKAKGTSYTIDEGMGVIKNNDYDQDEHQDDEYMESIILPGHPEEMESENTFFDAGGTFDEEIHRKFGGPQEHAEIGNDEGGYFFSGLLLFGAVVVVLYGMWSNRRKIVPLVLKGRWRKKPEYHRLNQA